MAGYRDRQVWPRGHRVVLDVYILTATFPKEESYGLTSQMRRAAASIPANIAEGCGRGGSAELARFLRIALGSAAELDYHLLLARDLSFIERHDHDRLASELAEIRKMLHALHHHHTKPRVP